MAEFVQQSIEEMVGELHEMRAAGLFDASELRGIMKKRKGYEYKLRRRTKEKRDYLQYIQYEMNVLALIKRRRKETKCMVKAKNIEVPVVKRIHKLFELVCTRFKDDLKLWLSHIEFCKSRFEKKLTSRVFTNVLKIHPHNADLWVVAAKHEIEMRDSMSNARALLQQALRINATSQELWIEYFRMELLNAELLRQKLADVTSETTEMNDVNSDVLNGGVAGVVYRNACNEFADDVPLRLKFLSISHLFDFTSSLQDAIYADLKTNFHHSELAKAAIASRPLTKLCCPGQDFSDDDVFEAQRECFRLFDKAVSRLPTELMWNKYLGVCLEILEKEASRQHSFQIVKHTLSVFRRAAENRLLSEQMTINWLRVLTRTGQVEEALRVSERAVVEMFPASVELWSRRLSLVMFTTSDCHKVLDVIKECIAACSSAKSEQLVTLWELIIEWSVIKCPQNVAALIESGLSSTAQSVVVFLKSAYLDLTAAAGDIHAVRRLYRRLSSIEPTTVDLLRKYVSIEMNQVKPKLKAVRRAYDEALLRFGSTSVDLWLDYIRMELTHAKGKPETVGHLHWRAIKDLDASLVDDFSRGFTLISEDDAPSADV